MASYDAVIERWLALERGESPGRGKHLRNWRMPSRAGVIESYGPHFPLAETIRDRKGRIRCFLLNGDRSTMVTMGKHQPAVRGVLGKSGITCIVLPFSALRAAGIDRATVRPVAVDKDWYEMIPEKIDHFDIEAIEWNPFTQPPKDFYLGGPMVSQHGSIPGRPELNPVRYPVRWDYQNTQYIEIVNPNTYIYKDGRSLEHDEEHGWHIKHWKHWLGASVFTAKVGRGWRTFVSSFDYQERPPLYFLAEIPRSAKPRTVEDAILALSPRIVHAAVAQGRNVKRQGDMFAIPTSLTIRELKQRLGRPVVRMQGVFGTDHVVTEQIVGPKGATYARGVIHHRPGGRVPDHQRVKLGKEWHLIVPNTVPRRAGAQVRVARR